MPLDPKAKRSMREEELVDSTLKKILEQRNCNTPEKFARFRELLMSDPDNAALVKTAAEHNSAKNMIKTLTPAELIFIKDLRESGQLEQQMAAADLSSQSIGSEQLREAIADMEEYTEMIKKNLEALQTHMARNMASVHACAGWDDRRTEAQKAKETALEEARARLEQLIKDEESEIKSLTQTVEEAIRGSMATPQDFNTDVLKTRFDVGPAPYDDLLRKLQALGWEIQCNHASDEAILKAARHYASEEVFLLVQACRVSLNVAFNEACRSYAKNAPKVGEYPRAVEAELLAIVEEIQSLWDEVVPVAHMAVEKQLMEPILRRIDLKKESRSAQNALICHYIGGCLQFLNERLTILANRISTAVYHHQSLLIAWEHSKMSQEKPKPGAPPKVVVQEPKATAKAEGQGQTALDLIKRHMQASGLSAKVFDPLAPPSKSITKLNEFVQKRAEKGDETFQTVHQLYEAAAKSGIGENELGTRMVLDCITADSLVSYGRRGAVLQDAQTEESIVALQKESEEVDALLAKLQLPGTGQMAKVLRPMFKKALKFLDNENGAGCYHTGATAIVSCRRCQEALKQIEITQRWSELPEFKDRWN